MSNLIDIQLQIEKLQKQATQIKAKQFHKTVSEIREKMAAFGITVKDLQVPSGAKAKTAVSRKTAKSTTKKILNFLMPYLAFLFFLGVNLLAGHDISPFYLYSFVIIALIIGDLLSKGNPARQLLIFSTMGIIALMTGILTEGMVSVYAFISVGLFCSTLWPCIFTLAIAGLGKHTNEGSGLLIMMIMGGGIISLLQGFLSGDQYLGIQWS